MDIYQQDDFSRKPYFDDFKREKHHYKVLFKPGIPVQTRELNNLQSMLQDQITVLGSHLFKNGSMVIPGTPRFNDTIKYIFIDKLDTDTTIGTRLIGKYLIEDIDLIEGISIRAIVENWIDFGDKAMLLLNYTNSAVITTGTEVTNKEVFSTGTEIRVEDSDEVVNTSLVSFDEITVPVNGTASTLSVAEGVYFVDGFFVHTPEQKIVVGYNNKKLSIKAGFKVNKIITTAYDDESLYDNALGSPNEAAPGADRFTIDLELTTLPLTDEETNFIELIRLEKGSLRVSNINPNYNVLADTLARRTYDESGDYAVNGFDVKVYEDLKDESNPNGFMTAEDGGDTNLFVAEISKGKGYVKGYEVENISNFFIEASKARTKDCEKTANDVIQVNEYGEYIYLAPGNQFFDLSKHPIIWLTDGQESTANVIGYCIPKYIDSVNISGQTIFKLYGTFQLSSTTSFGWQNLGGWRLSQLKNGPVLQVLNLTSVVSNFNVVDGLPLTSHTGYTPYAWDSTNAKLYVKKGTVAPVFNKTIAVTKGAASGYVVSIDYRMSNTLGGGELFKLSLSNIKTTKDAQGNHELQTDVALTTLIQTNPSGYGEYTLLGDGVFVGNSIAAHTTIDTAYFDNIVSIEASGKKLVINNTNYPNAKFAVSATVRKTLAVKSKTLTEGTTVIAKSSSRNMFLKHKDVYKIKHIFVSVDADTPATIDDEDIAKYYALVSNDTLDFYSNSSIKSTTGFGVPVGQLLVVYDYFIHGAGDVFTADSYISLRDNIIDESDVTHIGKVPLFKTKDSTYILTDYLDFRKPVRDNFFIVRASVTSGSGIVSVADDYQNVVAIGSKIFSNGFETSETKVTKVTANGFELDKNSTYTGTVYMVVNAPSAESAAEPFASSSLMWSAIADSTVTYDATYFVDRYDRIVIKSNGVLSYVYGVAGIAKYPDTPADSMSLATVRVPAYTRNANKIVYGKDDNRRYTMRDIGKIDRRVSNLEYYTTLTMKELDTKNVKILDVDGFDRFKSGLFVSNFKDFGVFNPFSEDTPYNATLVPEKRQMIPMEYSDSVPLKLNQIASDSFRLIGDKIYMPFNEVVEIQQPYATHYQTVNPYLVIAWSPELTLIPSTDAWVETEWAPVVSNVTSIVNNTTSASNDSGGATINYVDLGTRTYSGYYGAGNAMPDDYDEWQEGSTTSTSSTSTSSTSVSNSTSDYKLLGSSIIPLIRSREVHVTMVGGKPDTRFWVRFDNSDVTAHCMPYNPLTDVRGSFGEPLISDPMGRLDAIFLIPPASFMTGERVLEISDLDVSTNPDGLVNCVGTATYTANGTLETMQEIVNTVNTTTNNTHTTTTVNGTVTIYRQTNHYVNLGDVPPPAPPPNDGGYQGDPLAQSFFTTEVNGPGMFMTKVDVYFAKKDNTAPAFFELKEVVNGSPANGRVPGTLCIINPEDVTVSDDSTVATTVTFNEPVYLQSNREYALVVGSVSSRYALWVARMGEKIINEERVLSEQPSLGSLFKSQNNSTWTPYQLEDVKFRVWRAAFDTNIECNLVFENSNSGAKRKLNVSKIRTVSGSNMVRIYHPNHGTQVNENVKLYAESGVGIVANSPLETESFNGVTMSDIYGVRLVKEVYSINEYGIEIPGTATVTGYFENVGKYFYGESNINFQNYRLGVKEFVPGSTQVRYSTDLITGKDYDGGQTTHVRIPEMIVKNNENNLMEDVGLIQIPDNETNVKSATVNVRMSTLIDTVSPVISLGSNAITVSSIALNKPENDDEDSATGGSVNSKAVTQVIRLTTLSNSIRVYTAENKKEKDGIEVWVRTTSDRTIEERTWQKLVPEKVATQADMTTFIEHERVLEDVPEFDEYQIKIVFKGTDTTHYPAINDLRVITVAS